MLLLIRCLTVLASIFLTWRLRWTVIQSDKRRICLLIIGRNGFQRILRVANRWQKVLVLPDQFIELLLSVQTDSIWLVPVEFRLEKR
jgi:hypothetical protein